MLGEVPQAPERRKDEVEKQNLIKTTGHLPAVEGEDLQALELFHDDDSSG